MAIQVRRGNYADLDTSKLVQGEPFVTLDKVSGEYYVGIAISPSNVVRLATFDELSNVLTQCLDAKDDAEDSAEDSEAWAVGKRGGVDVPNTDPQYHNNAKYWADEAAASSGVAPATTERLGVVKPDGTTITVDNDGTIHGASNIEIGEDGYIQI